MDHVTCPEFEQAQVLSPTVHVLLVMNPVTQRITEETANRYNQILLTTSKNSTFKLLPMQKLFVKE